MKILFISVHGDPLARLGSAQAGGQNNYVRQLTEALEGRGHQIDVATHWNNKRNREFSYYGQNIRVIRSSGGQKRYVRKDQMYDLLPCFFEELEHKTDLSDYDVIHSNYWLSGKIGMMIKEKYHKPLVHTSHSLGQVKARMTGVIDKYRLETEMQILQSADCVIATTQDEKRKILRITDEHAYVKVISIGVSPLFLHAPGRVLPEQNRFMFTGRLNKAKGIVVLFQAFHRFLQDYDPQAELVIAGGGADDFDDKGIYQPKSQEIREVLEPVRASVRFIGPQTQEQLALRYPTCTALIVPSHYESFGMVASEAQAAGLPVIASRTGGLKDVVLGGETGLLFRNKNVIDLADCMKRICEDPELNLCLGQRAAQRAITVFNWKQISKDMEATYEETQFTQ